MTLPPVIRFFASLAGLLILSHCTGYGSAALSPQDLLNSSSEVVSFTIDDETSVETIASWIKDDVPSSAKLSCPSKQSACDAVFHTLNSQNIAVEEQFGATDQISLVYDRVVARNCPPHAFGCSVSASTLQMVRDYKQFTAPSLSDSPDSESAIKVYDNYLE